MARPALKPVLAFLAFLALALSWSLGTPLLSAADEPEVVIKAAASVRGEFSGPQTVFAFPTWETKYATPDFLETTYHLPHSLVVALDRNDPHCYSFFTDVPATCTKGATKEEVRQAGSTAQSHMDYFPLYYLLVGWPSLLVGGTHAIYAMRIVSALITALFMAAAFTVSTRRHGAGAVGVLAAATPAAIYWGAVVNPCGLEITSALLTWVTFLSLVRAEPGAPGIRTDRILFGISAATLLVVRPLGPLWLASILVAVLATSTGLRERARRALQSHGIRWVIGLLGAAVIAAGLWDLTQNSMGIVPKTNPHYTYAKGIYITLYQMPGDIAQMIGTIGWDDVPVPTFTSILWFGAIAAMVLMGFIFGNRRERLTLVALTAASILFPIIFEAYSGPTYGTGWQGRYGLPLAVGVPILAGEIMVRRMFAGGFGRVQRTLATTLAGTIALAYLCQVWWAWRRWAQGIFGVGFGKTVPLHAKWSPLIGWPLMLAAAVFGVGLLLYLMRRSAGSADAFGDGDGVVETTFSGALSGLRGSAPPSGPGPAAEPGGEERETAITPTAPPQPTSSPVS